MTRGRRAGPLLLILGLSALARAVPVHQRSGALYEASDDAPLIRREVDTVTDDLERERGFSFRKSKMSQVKKDNRCSKQAELNRCKEEDQLVYPKGKKTHQCAKFFCARRARRARPPHAEHARSPVARHVSAHSAACDARRLRQDATGHVPQRQAGG